MWIFKCAGSIINKWTVISATHCFKDDHGQPIERKNLAFVVGQHEIKHVLVEKDPKEWNIPFHEFDEVFSPRGYNGVTMKHDIAVAFVKKPFKFSATVKRIKLAPGNQKIKGMFKIRKTLKSPEMRD